MLTWTPGIPRPTWAVRRLLLARITALSSPLPPTRDCWVLLSISESERDFPSAFEIPRIAADDLTDSAFSRQDLQDYVHDKEVGFDILSIQEILEIAKRRGGNNPVYISLDIDVVEPGSAPATGTPESGGLSSREVRPEISLLN